MDCAIYTPTITTQTVVNPYADPSGLTYVSNSSLAYFGGKFWAVMDGATAGFVEGSTGQSIWLCTSTDGVTWAPAVQPFRNATYCNNPVSGSTLEWQPNLVVVGGELWCTWLGAYTYISKLTSPTGKWTNYRFEYSLTGTSVFMSSTITGAATAGRSLFITVGPNSDYYGYPTQNPIVLSSGVVVCPVVFESGSGQSTQTPATSTFTKALKFAALLKTSDGITWSMSTINTTAFGDFCAWEPFVVENPAGHVYVFIRNLDARVSDQDFMLVSHSLNGGATFSSAVSTKMMVPSTRGFARSISPKRWLMTHVDHPQNSNQTPDQALSLNVRRNGALFMSRRGGDDFVPGLNFSGTDAAVNYPQCIVGPDGDLYINYTSGTGLGVRRSLRVVKVSPPPDDAVAYIHPRSVNAFTATAGTTGPALNSDTPPYFDFNGLQQALSVTTLAATSGVTHTAWLRWDTEGENIADCRNQGSTTAFGHAFILRGLAFGSLNFLHGVTLAPGTPTFLAAAVDNTAQTVTVYVSTGGSFTTVTGHYQSILFSGLPADGDTVTVNGVTYTFRTSATLSNDVAIGANVAATIVNLSTKLTAASMRAYSPAAGNRLIMTRTDIATFSVSSGSSQISVETGIPLTGDHVSFGSKPAAVNTSIVNYAGRVYEARVYDSALSVANLTSLFNAKAASFGYSAMGGTSTAPGSPFLFLDPSSPNTTEFPLLAIHAASCEVVDPDTLRIHGEGSAGVELPYGATQLVIRYKLGATPTGGDKYVIATFGTVESPARLYIDSAHPTSLYANGRLVAAVADPTVYNTVTVIVSTNKITIGSFQNYFSGKPRCFLGSAYPESLLAVSKTIDYDASVMTATLAHRPGF